MVNDGYKTYFTEIAIDPGAGYYFDLEIKDGALVLNGQENFCG